MKRIVSLFLALVVLLCLSACRKNEDKNTESGTESSHATRDNTKEPTDNTTEGTKSPTEETTAKLPGNATTSSTEKTTTRPTEKTTVKLTEAPSAKPSQVTATPFLETPSAKPTEMPTQKPSENITAKPPEKTTAKNPWNTTAKPSDAPTEKPTTCEHTYTVATCTIPKICTKCEHIAGHTLPHNYKNGTCTVCGMAEMLVTFQEGDWVADIVKAGTSEQGEILSEYILDLSGQRGKYENVVCYSNASACVMNIGKVIYNEKTYYADFYPTCFFSVAMEDSGDAITVTVERGSGPIFEFVLTKNGETQLIVTYSSDTSRISVGTVFNKV